MSTVSSPGKPGPSWPPPMRYGLAFAIYLAALALRAGLVPVEVRLTYSTFYPAVVLSLYLCGLGPGLLALALSTATGIYYFTPPYRSFATDAAGLLAATAFVSSSLMSAWVVQQLRQSSARLASALQQLAGRERQLQAVVNDQTEMLFRFDANGRFVFANPAGRQVFGLTEAIMAHDTWRVLVMPQDVPAVTVRLRQLSPSNPVIVTENRFCGHSGQARWGEFVHRGFFKPDGSVDEVQTVGRDITDRVELQAQLAEANDRLQDLYDNAPCAYYSLDAEGKFLQINQLGLTWLGCSREQVVGRLGPRDFFSAESQARFDAHFPAFLATGQVGPLDFDLISRDGHTRRVSMAATAIRGEDGRFSRSRSVMYDVTELDRVRRQLQVLNREQEAMLDNDLVGIVKLVDRRAVWNNRAFDRMFGYAPGELDGQSARRLYLDDDTYEAVAAAAYPVLQAGGHYRAQLRMVRKGGEPLWVDISGVLLSSASGESMWMMQDITAMKLHQERVERVAFHDALTGLPNRLLLHDRLQQAIALTGRMNSLLAVCFIDLDGFKAVNDRLGHAAGDRLLQIVAGRLEASVRGNDTVARLGGDEFVLLLSHLQGRDECQMVLDRVLSAVNEPVVLDADQQASVSASIGVAFCTDGGTDADWLLASADSAMYAAKQAGRNGVRVAPALATPAPPSA